MLTFLATGDWAEDRILVSNVQCSRRTVPRVEQLIEQSWQEAQTRPGIKLFDGPMCRLESWRVQGDTLRLDLSQTSYKPFFGTNLSHPELVDQFGRDVMANPVGVSPALHTADNFLLLGRRNSSVAYYPNRIHPFAGCLEPRDGGNLAGAVRRELNEELSLQPSDVSFVNCTGIAEDRNLRQPELIFRAEVQLTRAQIEARVHAEEHHSSVAIPAAPAAVEEFVENPDLTPVGVASLLLWGRIRFGDDWFAKSARRLDGL